MQENQAWPEPSDFILKICGHLSEEEQREAEQRLQNYFELGLEIFLEHERREKKTKEKHSLDNDDKLSTYSGSSPVRGLGF